MSITLLLMMAVAIAGAIWHMHQSALQEARVTVDKLGIAISEQTARSVQATDIVVRGLRDRVLASGATTPEAFRAFFGRESMHQELKRESDELPQASAFTVIDASGHLVNFSRGWPIPMTDLSDRDYFGYLQSHDDSRMFVSRPVNNRGDGGLTAYLVRRVTSPTGQFMGIVLGAINLNYFQAFYKLISADDTSVTMLRADGTVLTGYPTNTQVSGKMPPGTPWYDMARNGQGTYLSRGLFGRSPRLVSVHALPDYPIVVDVAMSYALIEATWCRDAAFIGAGALCAIICTGLLMRALTLQLNRLEKSEGSLVTQNESLRLAQVRMIAQASILSVNQRDLTKQSAVLKTTLEHMDQGLMMVTAELEVAVCNRRAMEMLGLPIELMQRRPLFSEVLAYQAQTAEFSHGSSDINEFFRKGGNLELPNTYKRGRPDSSTIEVCSIPLQGGGFVRTYTDITAREQAAQELTYVADHDALTGLANRRVLLDLLRKAVEGGDPAEDGIAVMYLDLDHFKLINDTRGHAVGDQLLVQVARRMEACLRAGDLVARFGGDEFAAMLPAGADRHVVLAVAERLKAEVGAPYEIDGQTCLVGVSIGIALHPKDGTTADALLRSADLALYRAKAAGRNTVCFHEIADEREDLGRRILEQELRVALAAEQFELAYQPIFDVATGLPHSFEALVRWRHPTLGLLSPDRFIAAAEETGVINELGRWVIRTACTEAATWALPVRLAVNLSSAQFGQQDLEQQVVAALEVSGLPPTRLDLEVTESLLISDRADVHSTMAALQRRGVRLVMDDFGTGHSSLKTLQSFPFQQIKIDRAFVAKMHDREGGGAIIQAVLTMAATMKLEVVAEGVETQAQLKALRDLGCNYIQGFLLQRPQTAEWTRHYLWRCTTTRGEDPRVNRLFAT